MGCLGMGIAAGPAWATCCAGLARAAGFLAVDEGLAVPVSWERSVWVSKSRSEGGLGYRYMRAGMEIWVRKNGRCGREFTKAGFWSGSRAPHLGAAVNISISGDGSSWAGAPR